MSTENGVVEPVEIPEGVSETAGSPPTPKGEVLKLQELLTQLDSLANEQGPPSKVKLQGLTAASLKQLNRLLISML